MIVRFSVIRALLLALCVVTLGLQLGVVAFGEFPAKDKVFAGVLVLPVDVIMVAVVCTACQHLREDRE